MTVITIERPAPETTNVEESITDALGLLFQISEGGNALEDRYKALFVTGSAGNGKTRMLRKTFYALEFWRPTGTSNGRPKSPIVQIHAPSSCTAKSLAQTILMRLGIEPLSRATQAALFAILRAELRRQGVCLVHIDEAHHMVRRNDDKQITETRDFLKSVLWDPEWPVRLVCSGLPALQDLLRGDPQMSFATKVVEI